MRVRLALAVLEVLLLASCDGHAGSAQALEERLYAPCCWRQTLREHDSPVASELRAEIVRRIDAGDAPQQIEVDLVRRYGERIRALPAGGDPRWMIGIGAALAAALGLVLVTRTIRRLRRTVTDAARPQEHDPDDEERLDDELALVE